MEISFKANIFNLKQANYIKNRLAKSSYVDIICHAGTDEDAIASARAMRYFINSLKVPSRIIADKANDTFTPNNIKDDFINANSVNTKFLKPNTVVCVDFSSLSRVNANLREYINKAPKLFCFDHHGNGDLINNGKNIYVDTMAKSCSGIMLRFFQALKVKIPDNIKSSLLCGMIDDLSKNNYMKFGKYDYPYLTNDMLNDETTLFLYNKLLRKVPELYKDAVMKHLNVLNNLNTKERQFKNKLPAMLKYTNNKKFAYAVIPPYDRNWSELGGDNRITSAILRNFRLSVLKNIENLDSVAIFYPDAHGLRISIHSKNKNVMNFYRFIRENVNSKFIGGGHDERGGGTSLTLDSELCDKWVKLIVEAAEAFFK